MSSSSIKSILLGDTGKYERILRKYSLKISKKYPNRRLSMWFDAMPGKFVSVGPMSNCDALLSDLKISAPDKLLAGIGMMAFHISTYDDIVDETPSSKEEIASLAYSGNIALIEGMEVMVNSGLDAPLHAALEEIKKNSYMQQRITAILWRKSLPSTKEYFDGIKHIISWASIGPMAALAYSNRMKYASAVGRFCENYGIAIQIIDDINEIEEDLNSGYWSFPIIEAKRKGIDLRKKSARKTEMLDDFKAEAIARISNAKESLPVEWKHLGTKAEKLKKYIDGYQV